jgi:hypothetical protein
MKKYITNYTLVLAAFSMLLAMGSCSKKLDEVYLNPNAAVKQPIEKILPGILAYMTISQQAGGGGIYGIQHEGQFVGRFVQNWATNSTGNQYDQMGDNFVNKSDNMGSIWAMFYYGQGENINKVIEWGTEEKKWDYVGVAQAVRAWGWLMLTDINDDVILNEAFRPDQLVFKYNTQPEVYEEVKRTCFAALENLNKTGDGVNQANLAVSDQYLNGGDMNKWKKFVYGVLARTYNRYTNKASYQPDSVVYYCNLAMQTNAENTKASWSNAGTSGTYSYWGPFRGNIGTFRQTKFIADFMRGVNTQFPTGSVDPRAPYIIRENPNGTYRGIIPNRGGLSAGLALGDSSHNFWGGLFQSTTAPSSDANCRYIFKNNPIFPIITASEIQFLKAEALLKKGSNHAVALAAYRKGIELNIEQLRTDYEVSVPTAMKMTDATRDAFLANPFVIPPAANLTLSHIMMQKYVALYGWGCLETWVDMRRYHYTDLDPITTQQVYREFAPPTGSDLYTSNGGKWIYKHRPRYNSEYLYNVAELNRLGAFDLDFITRQPWFAKP